MISQHIKKYLPKKKKNYKMEQVENEGGKIAKRQVQYYNLDIIISIYYGVVRSKQVAKFRIWTTKTLKQHITQGYIINKNHIKKNYQVFIDVMKNIKSLTKNKINSGNGDVLVWIKSFINTWFSLEAFYGKKLPNCNIDKNKIKLESDTLYLAVDTFAQGLISKKQMENLFTQEKKKGNFYNIFQSIFSKNTYLSIEEKATHFLYFIVKNYPFNNGNKRTGVFTLIWFLNQVKFDYKKSITSQTLTILTLFIASSNADEEDKLIGFLSLLLSTKSHQEN